jgi:hypothetical protein
MEIIEVHPQWDSFSLGEREKIPPVICLPITKHRVSLLRKIGAENSLVVHILRRVRVLREFGWQEAINHSCPATPKSFFIREQEKAFPLLQSVPYCYVSDLVFVGLHQHCTKRYKTHDIFDLMCRKGGIFPIDARSVFSLKDTYKSSPPEVLHSCRARIFASQMEACTDGLYYSAGISYYKQRHECVLLSVVEEIKDTDWFVFLPKPYPYFT